MAAEINIVLVNPEIPHNTGAIGRLCVGLDCQLHLIRPLGFQLNSAAIRRAGLDYWPHLRLAIHDTWAQYLGATAPAQLAFASTRATRTLYQCAFIPGTHLVFGSESAGLPQALYDRYADALFRIPMPGEHGRSLNLANAAAIAMYEAYRQLNL